jgi:DNA repair exonuclease SbcCD ATPase subunit
MMGSQGAPASMVDELKNLLGVVSDPVKLKAALDNLQAQQKQLMALIDKNSEIEAVLIKKEQSIEKAADDLGKLSVVLSAKELALNRKEADFDNRFKSLKYDEDALKADKLGFDDAKVKINKALDARQTDLDRKISEVLRHEERAVHLQAELDAKLNKIKAAMV